MINLRRSHDSVMASTFSSIRLLRAGHVAIRGSMSVETCCVPAVYTHISGPITMLFKTLNSIFMAVAGADAHFWIFDERPSLWRAMSVFGGDCVAERTFVGLFLSSTARPGAFRSRGDNPIL